MSSRVMKRFELGNNSAVFCVIVFVVDMYVWAECRSFSFGNNAVCFVIFVISRIGHELLSFGNITMLCFCECRLGWWCGGRCAYEKHTLVNGYFLDVGWVMNVEPFWQHCLCRAWVAVRKTWPLAAWHASPPPTKTLQNNSRRRLSMHSMSLFATEGCCTPPSLILQQSKCNIVIVCE